MKVLILEDDINKLNAITAFLSTYKDIMYTHQMSYHSGMQALLNTKVDLLLLDMSMPIYDIATRKPGGRLLPLAGRDILFQLQRKGMLVPTIVITQYEDFDGHSLADLDQELSQDFPEHYIGFVYYSITQDGWKEKLDALLYGSRTKGKDNDD